MNTKLTSSIPLAVSINPFTGYKAEFYSFDNFEEGCVDMHNFKIKPETYIHPEYVDYDCEGCSVLAYVNPQNLSEVVGYAINGHIRKYDIEQTPHELLDSKKVAWVVGTRGFFASNTNKVNIPYVLATDNLDLFIKIAQSGVTVLFHQDIDQAYQLINYGMPETIFRVMTGFNQPKKNQDLFIKLDENFKVVQQKRINEFFLSEVNNLKQIIYPEIFTQSASSNQWGELLPLLRTSFMVDSSYPIYAFPKITQDAIKQAAYHLHVPLALAGQTALGLMVYIAQEHAQAPSDRSSATGQPCSFGTFSIFESGGGKDETRNLLARSISELHKKAQVQYLTDRRIYNSLSAKDRKSEQKPTVPTTLYKKGTTQGITKAISRSVHNSFAWQTTEGAMVLGGYSFTSDTMGESLGVINHLMDKGESSSDVQGDEEPEIIVDIRFSVDLSIQGVMAKKPLHNEELRQQGFLARFLFAAPEPLPTREVTKELRRIKASEDIAIIAFNELSKQLKYPLHKKTNSLNSNRILFLKDDAAETLHVAFENFISKEAQEGGKYHSIRPNALRMIQYSLRVATVLAYFTPKLDCIDANTMQGAINLCTYSLDEWIRYYSKDEETDCDLMLKWLLKQKSGKVLKSCLSTHATPSRLRTKSIRDDVLTNLCDCNYVKIEKIAGKDYVVLNPTLL